MLLKEVCNLLATAWKVAQLKVIHSGIDVCYAKYIGAPDFFENFGVA
jgi:hypothetical protein